MQKNIPILNHDPLAQSLEHLGTPLFLRSLVSYIQAVFPSLPVDPVILQSILLSLIAGGKHLILRTSEDDIGLVIKIAVKILSSVLGLATHKVKVRSKDSAQSNAPVNPELFLRSLFLPTSGSLPAVASSGSLYNSQDDSSTLTGHKALKKRRHRRVSSRSRSRTTTGRSRGNQLSRPPTDGVALTNSIHSVHSPTSTVSDPFGEHGAHTRTFTSNSMRSLIFPHSHSDPTPIRFREAAVPQLPKALVTSGLENASLITQRTLTTVLTERRLVIDAHLGSGADVDEMEGVWPLPHNFLLIYVCSLDEWERPNVHKSLLDKFSMSATVTLQPAVRSAAINFFQVRPLSFRGSPVLSPVSLGETSSSTSFFPQPTRQWSSSLQSAAQNSSPVITACFMETLRQVRSKVHFPAALNMYLSDLFSAARNHPQLEGRLISASASKDAYELSCAWRVLAGDPSGMELIQEAVLLELPEETQTPLGSSLNETSDENSRNSSGNVHDAFKDMANGNVPIGGITSQLELRDGDVESGGGFSLPILEVTQSDIARIVPRVISHRVRVRDGPRNEILASAMFGATTNPSDDDAGLAFRGRRSRKSISQVGRVVTVKDILINILHEV